MREEDRPIFEALSDEQLLALNIQREAGGESREGKIAVGTVTLERVDHRDWDGKTLKEVVLKPSQFTWTMPEYGLEYYIKSVKIARNIEDRHDMAECLEIAKGLLSGKIPRDPDLAAAHCCQYLNPKVAASAKKHWLRLGYKMIKQVGQHEFYVR